WTWRAARISFSGLARTQVSRLSRETGEMPVFAKEAPLSGSRWPGAAVGDCLAGPIPSTGINPAGARILQPIFRKWRRGQHSQRTGLGRGPEGADVPTPLLAERFEKLGGNALAWTARPRRSIAMPGGGGRSPLSQPTRRLLTAESSGGACGL